MAPIASPRSHRRARCAALTLGLAGATTLAACGGDGGEAAEEIARVPAARAAALAQLDDGAIVFGELTTGRVVRFELPEGDAAEVAQLQRVDADLPQGGLLDLAAVEGELLASFTNDDGVLEVASIDLADGSATTRWTGPEAQDQANGGRIRPLGDGTLLIGIGDLLDPELIDDPTAPNGKLIAVADALDPFAGPFNNPFAYDTDGDGTAWVADNAPGRRPERLVRATANDVEVVAEWDEDRVPSGLAVLDDGRLAICEYATFELVLVDPANPGDASGTTIAEDCRYGVIALDGDRLAYAAEGDVVVLQLAD